MSIQEEHPNLYILMCTLYSLSYKGISIKETVEGSLRHLLDWYHQSGDLRYLETALLYAQAYVNLGNAFEKDQPMIAEISHLMDLPEEVFRPSSRWCSNRVKLTKPQVRKMIGKWMPSRENPMTIGEVVEDIIWRVSNHLEGERIYRHGKKDKKEEYGGEELYELVIRGESCYFFDVKNLKFYTFLIE